MPLQVLAREQVLPSRNGVVVQAALRASVQLALSRQDPTQLIPRQVSRLAALHCYLRFESQAGEGAVGAQQYSWPAFGTAACAACSSLGAWPICRVRTLCEANIRADLPMELQRVAHSCLLHIAASEGGVNAAVEAALAAVGGTEVMQLRWGVQARHSWAGRTDCRSL